MLPFILVGFLFAYLKHGYNYALIPYTLLYGVLAFLVYALFLFLVSLPVNIKKPVERDSRFYRFLAEVSAGLILGILNDHIVYKAKEELPDGRFLLVQNHRSMLDIVASLYAFRGYQIGFVTKPENISTPILGKIAHAICSLPIDRDNPRNAVETINRAADYIQSDVCSIGIYPEGTRCSEEGKLLPFRNGAFKIATKAGAPIAVTTIRYDGNAWNPFVSCDVEIKLVGILQADKVKKLKTDEIGIRCRRAMLKSLGYALDEECERPGENRR